MAAKRIGVRQLKNEATQIVRSVREERAEYIVTVNGEPVATIRPIREEPIIDSEADRQLIEEKIQRMHALAREISSSWNSSLSATEAVAEQRR